MAKLFAMSVMDNAVGAFGRPIFVATRNVGYRSFVDEVNRNAPDNPMFQHPQDFALFHIGYFDEDSGIMTNVEPVPERIALATDVLVKEVSHVQE